MKENRYKFAEDMTAFGLAVLIVLFLVILFTSCSSSSDIHYQQHLRTTHHQNFVSKDNGGCGWNR